MKFKIGDEVAAYKVADMDDGWTNPERFVGKIESITGNIVWIDSIAFHIKAIRKIKRIPKIFKDFKIGDKVHVFNFNADYLGTGFVARIDEEDGISVDSHPNEPSDERTTFYKRKCHPLMLRKVKE